jgi:membrane protein
MNAPSRRSRMGRSIQFVRVFLRELSETRTTGMAAEMAFWVFLSLVPLAAVAGLVLARIAVNSADAGTLTLLTSLPPQTRQLVRHQLGQVAAWNGGSVGAPAAVVFVWLGSGGVHSIFELLEVKARAPRSWWKRRLYALATCVALSVGTAAIALIFTGVNRALSLLRGLEVTAFSGEGEWIGGGLRLALGALTAVVLVAGLYWVAVPRNAKTRMPVWPGAFLAVALQSGFGYGYIFYLSRMGAHSAYQAGLSIVGVTLMALYLFAVALLVGAELNYVLGQQRVGRTPAAHGRREALSREARASGAAKGGSSTRRDVSAPARP